MVYERQRQDENMWFKEPHVPSPVSREAVRKRQRMCGSKNHTFSVLCCGGSGREAENMGFFEPHVLSPVSQEMVCDMQGEMCGSKNRIYPSPVLWDS